jgi:hypothetical protein
LILYSRGFDLKLHKYKSVITIFCVLLLTCFLLAGTAAATENKNTVNHFENEKSQMFAYNESIRQFIPDANTQIKIGNGSESGGGVRMQIGGSDSPMGGSGPLKWIIIAIGIAGVIGIAYYLLKREK